MCYDVRIMTSVRETIPFTIHVLPGKVHSISVQRIVEAAIFQIKCTGVNLNKKNYYN